MSPHDYPHCSSLDTISNCTPLLSPRTYSTHTPFLFSFTYQTSTLTLQFTISEPSNDSIKILQSNTSSFVFLPINDHITCVASWYSLIWTWTSPSAACLPLLLSHSHTVTTDTTSRISPSSLASTTLLIMSLNPLPATLAMLFKLTVPIFCNSLYVGQTERRLTGQVAVVL